MSECVACSPGQMLFPIPSPQTKRELTNLGRFTHWLHHRLKIIVEFEKKEKKTHYSGDVCNMHMLILKIVR